MKCWHIEETSDVIQILSDKFCGKAFVDYSALKTNLAEKIRFKREEEQSKDYRKSKGINGLDFHCLSDKGKADIEKYRMWMETHRYPETTIRTYTGMVTTFLRFISPKEASEGTSDDLLKLTDEYILPAGLSHSYQNQMISAVKKFYMKIYRSVINLEEISRPRPQHRLPNVLSKDEVKKVLNASLNEKHRVMLSLDICLRITKE